MVKHNEKLDKMESLKEIYFFSICLLYKITEASSVKDSEIDFSEVFSDFDKELEQMKINADKELKQMKINAIKGALIREALGVTKYGTI